MAWQQSLAFVNHTRPGAIVIMRRLAVLISAAIVGSLAIEPPARFIASRPVLGVRPRKTLSDDTPLRAIQLNAAAASSSGGASETSSIINLSKNIVGSGVLALAGGVAAFSSARDTLV